MLFNAIVSRMPEILDVDQPPMKFRIEFARFRVLTTKSRYYRRVLAVGLPQMGEECLGNIEHRIICPRRGEIIVVIFCKAPCRRGAFLGLFNQCLDFAQGHIATPSRRTFIKKGV